jgi:hypothetical protein
MCLELIKANWREKKLKSCLSRPEKKCETTKVSTIIIIFEHRRVLEVEKVHQALLMGVSKMKMSTMRRAMYRHYQSMIKIRIGSCRRLRVIVRVINPNIHKINTNMKL